MQSKGNLQGGLGVLHRFILDTLTFPRVEMKGFVMQAVRTATNAQSSGDCGRIMIVLLTDGRANVSLGKSNEDPDAMAEGAPKPTQELLKTEVLDMAKRCGSGGFNLLVIDTENKVRLLTHSHNTTRPDMHVHYKR